MTLQLVIISFLVVFVFSYLVNVFLLRFFRQVPQSKLFEIRWSKQHKPLLGGISFLMTFVIGLILQHLFIGTYKDTLNVMYFGSVIALFFAFIIGFIDDNLGTIPWLKFVLQLFCASMLIITDNVIQIFDYQILNIFLSLIWIIGIINALNFLDNMDAIASVVSIPIIFLVILLKFLFTIDFTYSIVYVCLLSALMSFIFFNWNPSKMFMGDSGSMFLGTLLAITGIHFFWNIHLYTSIQSYFIPFIIVAVVFALPIIDSFCVVTKRIFRFKRSPFIGGKDHTTHHLVYLGFSERQTAIIFLILSITNAAIGITSIWTIPKWSQFHSYALLIWFFLQLIAFLVITNLNVEHEKST